MNSCDATVDHFADTEPLPTVTPQVLMEQVREARAEIRKQMLVAYSEYATDEERARAKARVQAAHKAWQELDKVLQEELYRACKAHREGCRDNDMAAAIAAYETIASYLEA